MQTTHDGDAFHITCLLPERVTPQHCVPERVAEAVMRGLAVAVGDVRPQDAP